MLPVSSFLCKTISFFTIGRIQCFDSDLGSCGVISNCKFLEGVDRLGTIIVTFCCPQWPVGIDRNVAAARQKRWMAPKHFLDTGRDRIRYCEPPLHLPRRQARSHMKLHLQECWGTSCVNVSINIVVAQTKRREVSSPRLKNTFSSRRR